MAQETLQVASLVSQGSWVLGAGSDVVSAVQQPDDDASSYVQSAGANSLIQYAVTPTSVLRIGDTVNFVRVVARLAKLGGTTARGVFHITVSATTADSSLINITAAFTDFTADFALNPSGAAWSKSDIDSALISINRTTSPGAGELQLTSFYVIVDFTPIPVNYSQAVTAASTSTPAIKKNVGTSISKTSTSSISLFKTVGKNVSASATASSSIKRGIGKAVTVASTCTAKVVKQIGKSVSAASTGATLIIRSIQKNIIASSTGTASIKRAVATTVLIVGHGTASVLKQIAKSISVASIGVASFARGLFKTIQVTSIGNVFLAFIKHAIPILKSPLKASLSNQGRSQADIVTPRTKADVQ